MLVFSSFLALYTFCILLALEKEKAMLAFELYRRSHGETMVGLICVSFFIFNLDM